MVEKILFFIILCNSTAYPTLEKKESKIYVSNQLQGKLSSFSLLVNPEIKNTIFKIEAKQVTQFDTLRRTKKLLDKDNPLAKKAFNTKFYLDKMKDSVSMSKFLQVGEDGEIREISLQNTNGHTYLTQKLKLTGIDSLKIVLDYERNRTTSFSFPDTLGYKELKDKFIKVETYIPSFNIKKEKLKISKSVPFTIVEFSYIGCYPCLKQYNFLKSKLESKKDKFDILALNPVNSTSEIEVFNKKYSADFKQYSLRSKQKIVIYPTTFILSKKRKIVYSSYGFYKENLDKVLDSLLSVK